MGWESSGVVGFDLGPLLEGQMRTAKLKSAYSLLIIGPRGFGALSLRWIQFASVFRCARSSFNLKVTLRSPKVCAGTHFHVPCNYFFMKSIKHGSIKFSIYVCLYLFTI